MRRRSSNRRVPYAPRQRYSITTKVLNTTVGTGTVQQSTDILTSAEQGILKIKNIYLNLNVVSTAAQAVYWAVIYVPDGYTANTLTTTPGGELYEPQQNVIASGSFIADTTSFPVRIFSRLAKNLHSGDKIKFVTLGTAATSYQFVGTLRYAVAQ